MYWTSITSLTVILRSSAFSAIPGANIVVHLEIISSFQVVNGYYQKDHFQKLQGGPEGLTSKLVFRSDIDEIISRCTPIFAPGIAEKAEELNITSS